MQPLSTDAHVSDTSLLYDSFGRRISYLRLALTDRCNLRCRYCMPEKGIDILPAQQLLCYEEIFKLLRIFKELGITKIRLTGGEPFVRRDAMDFLRRLLKEKIIPGVHLTTNGTHIMPHLEELARLGISGINFSLDTLNAEKFKHITRRRGFEKTRDSIHTARKLGIPVKINMVVMAGVNEDEIEAFARLTEKNPFDVRFIEQMPFNGADEKAAFYSAARIESRLKSAYPGMKTVITSSKVARGFQIPGFAGRIGIIAAYSRTFCGSCNRIRLNPYGGVQTCLYGAPVLNLRDMLRGGSSDDDVTRAIQNTVMGKPVDGFAAEEQRKGRALPSMASIGG